VEVRPGYKLTEVGVIPEDWRTVAATDIVDPNAPICYGVVQVGRDVDTGVPIVAIKFVKEIGSAPLHRTARDLERPYARSRVKSGDVLISIKGTIGRVGLVPDGFEGNISRELARLRPRREYCGEYIAHQLEADSTQARISRAVVGTTRLEFSIATLRQFQLPVPPSSSEQHAIAEALSDVDALLGALDQLIAKKRDLKQAAMQQLLTGQTHLPGFHGEWEFKRLGEVADISKGEQLQSQGTAGEGDIPHYNGGISPSSYTHRANAPADSIAISEGGNSCGYVQFIAQPFWCGGHCYLVKPKSVDKRFLYHALKARQQSIMGLRVGSGLPNVQKSALQGFSLALPGEMSEQTAIATSLSDMDAELAALEARRAKTHALKQAMMQELLTGRTRLVRTDDCGAEAC
jgi:type I restriction enzyme S subunit